MSVLTRTNSLFSESLSKLLIGLFPASCASNGRLRTHQSSEESRRVLRWGKGRGPSAGDAGAHGAIILPLADEGRIVDGQLAADRGDVLEEPAPVGEVSGGGLEGRHL